MTDSYYYDILIRHLGVKSRQQEEKITKKERIQKIREIELFIKKNILDTRFSIVYLGLYIGDNSKLTLYPEILWKERVLSYKRGLIESNLRLKIMERFPELHGVVFLKT